MTNMTYTFSRGSLFQYDPTVSFWNFLAVGNYAGRFYKYAMQDVAELQADLQRKANLAVTSLEDTVLNSWFYPRSLTDGNNEGSQVVEEGAIQSIVVGLITTLTVSQGDSTVLAWSQLLPKLITKYHDGYRAENLDKASISMKKLFYNKFWLDVTGYWNNKPNSGGDTIMFMPTPSSQSDSTTMIVALILAIITFFIGLRVGSGLKNSVTQNTPASSSTEAPNGVSYGFQSVQSAILSHVPIDFKLFNQSGHAYSKPNRRDYVSIEI